MIDKQIPNERRQYEYKSVFTYTDNTTDDNDKIMENLHKQLTAKEQECEKLREERNEYFELMAIRTEVLAKIANKLGINTAIIENKEIFNKIDQLKTENQQLKKAEEYDSRYNDMQAEIDCGEKIISQLKQTLTEIKEIARAYRPDIVYSDIGSIVIDMVQILQKISEVENEITTR